jgi:hypothetical protein
MHELVEVKTKTTTAEPPTPATITTGLELLREVSVKLQYILENRELIFWVA